MGRKGLPAKYLKQAWKMKGSTKKNALKRAWALFRKSKGTSKSRSTKTKTSRKTKSNPKGGKRMGKNPTATLFKLIRYGALIAPGAKRAYDVRGAGVGKMLQAGFGAYAGINLSGQFDSGLAVSTWSPYLAANLATYVIPKINGLIRRLF